MYCGTKCHLENETAWFHDYSNKVRGKPSSGFQKWETHEWDSVKLFCLNLHTDKHAGQGALRNYVKAFWFTTYRPPSTWELAAAGGDVESTFRKVMDEETTRQHMIWTYSWHAWRRHSLSRDECIHLGYPIKSQGWWTDLLPAISHKRGS